MCYGNISEKTAEINDFSEIFLKNLQKYDFSKRIKEACNYSLETRKINSYSISEIHLSFNLFSEIFLRIILNPQYFRKNKYLS